jgi:hypothetical protein
MVLGRGKVRRKKLPMFEDRTDSVHYYGAVFFTATTESDERGGAVRPSAFIGLVCLSQTIRSALERSANTPVSAVCQISRAFPTCSRLN